jgi:antirestriction protein ArdC
MDAYQVITDRIIGQLEKGTVPWHRPWNDATAPKNMISGKQYNGINLLLLNSLGFESSYFLTYNQAKEQGGHIKRGEHGFPVIYWNIQKKVDENGEERTIPFLKYFTVFNVAQCEDVQAPEMLDMKHHDVIPECETVVDEMPKRPEIKPGNGRAFYSPVQDFVGMPDLGSFDKPEEYYSTLFHELTHSTMHPTRLNRKASGAMLNFGGRGEYAKEELVAEMGAAFLCGHTGLIDRVVDQSAAYIESWLQVFKQDHKILVAAAGQAQKAANFILGKLETA